MSVIKVAGELVQGGEVMGVMTLVFLGFFVGWAWWAYAPKNRTQMEKYGRMPLDGGDDA